MSKPIFDRTNPIWHHHNIVITISILALLITLPLTILMVATTERTADVRSRAAEIAGNYGPIPTPTPSETPTLSCKAEEQVATIAANYFNNADDITPVAYNNDGYAYKYDLLDSNDITESLDNWELSYKIILRSVKSGQWGFNTSLHTCLNGCEQSGTTGEGVTHWSSVINDTSHFYPDDPASHQRGDYLAMIFNSLYDANRPCPSRDGSATFCDKDDNDYYSYMFELDPNQEYGVKLTKMGARLGVEISDQAGNLVFSDNIPANNIPMNWVDIASWGNLTPGTGLIYDVSVNENKRLDWYVKRPDTSTDMRFELDDLVVRGCTASTVPTATPTPTTSIAPSCQELLDLATNRWRASCGDENYDPRADVNKDGTINTLDVALITTNIGNEAWCAEKLQDETNPCEAQIISDVYINPPTIETIVGSQPIGLSALAYDTNNQPIWSGISYEWGISSTGSIGRLEPIYSIITNFIPLNSGTGQVWVIARQGNRYATRSIPATVGLLCRADFNHNGDIDIDDLQVFISEAQKDCSQQQCRSDFNGNGDIDIEDLQVLIEDAQKDCSVPATPIPTLTPLPPAATSTPPPDLCGNDNCDPGETIENCPRDCNNDI